MRAGIFVFGLVASFVLLVFFSGCTQVPAYCGDGTCNGSESASTCPMDCALGTTSGGLGSAQSMPVAGAAGHGTGTGGGAGHVPGDGYLPCGTQGDWYNVGSETCCTKDVSGSVTVGYVGPISSKCCGTSSAGQWLYNPSTQVCCSGTDGAGDIGSSGSKCCGTSHEVAYNPSYSVCCFGTDGIASIGYNKNLSCCGDVSKRPYDDTKETCCIGTDGVGRPDGPRAGLDCCGTV
ncbi:MAG: hypothetical protein NTY48_01095, partial [Candidatus Diapherotrites archaeon]|nr:hypothetical protein [Candidatus Diapherotrites archaeon]